MAKQYGATVIALAGCVSKDAGVCNSYGIDAYFPILDAVRPLEDAMSNKVTTENLERTAEQVFRLICKEKCYPKKELH